MRAIIMISALCLLSGCSAVNSMVWRPTNDTPFPKPSRNGWSPELAGQSVDASRRMILAGRNPALVGNPARVVCAEPPPDAATSILAKGLVDVTGGGPTARGLKVQDEFSATALALANRTAAVEIWRTTSSTYCILLMNGWQAQAASYLSTGSLAMTRLADVAKPDDKKPTPAELLEAAQLALTTTELALVSATQTKEIADIDLAAAKGTNEADKIEQAQQIQFNASRNKADSNAARDKAKLEVEAAKAKAGK